MNKILQAYNEYANNNYNNTISMKTLAYFKYEAHKKQAQAHKQTELLHKEYYILTHKNIQDLTYKEYKRIIELRNMLHA